MDNSIIFSILVPVYNAEKYLPECIESVLNQTYQNYELILVNDGSVDQSGSICDEYAEKYSMIHSYHKENGGQLHTRKYAVDHAVGKYCVFLDSDDWLEPNALEKIYQTFEVTRCDCVIFGMAKVNEGKVVSTMQDSCDCVLTDKRAIFRKCLLSVTYNSICRKVTKTDILKGLDYSGYYDVRHGEDLLQSLDILKRSKCVTFIKDTLYNYRVNLNSVTQSISYENYSVDNIVRERVLRFIKEEAVFSSTDVEDYRCFCIQLLVKKLYIIAKFNINKELKKELFEKIKSSSYYIEFIDNGKYNKKKVGLKAIYFELFRKSYYSLLEKTTFIFKKLSE